jgi:hypothetical protein
VVTPARLRLRFGGVRTAKDLPYIYLGIHNGQHKICKEMMW